MLLGVARGAHTYAAALASESSLLATKYGVPASDYHFVDGSGGGDTSAKSSAVTKMLEELAKAPEHAAFLNDLPILGKDGSLSSVTEFEKDGTLKGAAGQVRAKTGTWVGGTPDGKPILKGQAFGGYITTKSGKHLTYQLVVNDVPITGSPTSSKCSKTKAASRRCSGATTKAAKRASPKCAVPSPCP
jgi:D-alanyl-D-alanine carboxypeptidase